MPHQNGMPTHDELRSMSRDDLKEKINHQYSLTPDARHLMLSQLYRDELVRREQDESTIKMFNSTEKIKYMTVIILVATILSLLVGILSLFKVF